MDRTLVKPLEPKPGVTRCTVYESMLLPYQAASLMLWYPEPIDPARFQAALARVLSDYPIYAGRLFRDGEIWCIEHGSAGTTFEVADSAQPASSVPEVPSRKHIKEVCPRLSLLRAARGKAPLTAIRLTRTPSGSVLGITWHHIVGDMHSTGLFLKALSLAYREQPYRTPLLVEDRQTYLDERVPPSAAPVRPSRTISWWELLRRLLYFITHPLRPIELKLSWAEIAEIRDAASQDKPVTVHDALYASLFSKICRLRNAAQPAHLVVTLDYRKRFGLPANLVGNMVDLVTTTGSSDEPAASVAASLRDRISDFQEGPLGCHEMPRWKAAYPKISQRLRFSDGILDPIPGNLYVTSMLGFRAYRLVFESKGPVLMRIGELSGVIHWTGVLVESPDMQGVTAMLRLPAALVQRLSYWPESEIRDRAPGRSAPA